jgi:Uncharacterised protein family UPF0547
VIEYLLVCGREVVDELDEREAVHLRVLSELVGPSWPAEEVGAAGDLIEGRITRGQGPTKTCPECAEEVKEAAKVCRFCAYRFDS